MKQDIKCKLGMHQYEIIDTKDIKNRYDISIGQVIISRCKNCGKIKTNKVFTNEY